MEYLQYEILQDIILIFLQEILNKTSRGENEHYFNGINT